MRSVPRFRVIARCSRITRHANSNARSRISRLSRSFLTSAFCILPSAFIRFSTRSSASHRISHPKRLSPTIRILSVRPLLLALLALATPAAAATITLTRDGAPVSGEVCRFRSGDAANPFKRWFASQEVACGGTIPKGSWNVFGRTADAISAVSVLVSGEDVVSLELQSAATVLPLLPQGKGGLIYVPRRKSGFAFDDKTARVNVPANEELWLFVVDKAKPMALFPIPAIEAGKERSVDARGDGPAAVVGWLQIPERSEERKSTRLNSSHEW